MSGFTQKDRDMLIVINERLSNHLAHHDKYDAKRTKWLIAITVLLLGLVGKVVIGLVM